MKCKTDERLCSTIFWTNMEHLLDHVHPSNKNSFYSLRHFVSSLISLRVFGRYTNLRSIFCSNTGTIKTLFNQSTLDFKCLRDAIFILLWWKLSVTESHAEINEDTSRRSSCVPPESVNEGLLRCLVEILLLILRFTHTSTDWDKKIKCYWVILPWSSWNIVLKKLLWECGSVRNEMFTLLYFLFLCDWRKWIHSSHSLRSVHRTFISSSSNSERDGEPFCLRPDHKERASTAESHEAGGRRNVREDLKTLFHTTV